MKRLYIKVIKSCFECPNLGTDQNITRHQCSERLGKFICWHGSELEDTDYIPEWCPLPENEEFKEEEFDVS